jgi:hypothetical protein
MSSVLLTKTPLFLSSSSVSSAFVPLFRSSTLFYATSANNTTSGFKRLSPSSCSSFTSPIFSLTRSGSTTWSTLQPFNMSRKSVSLRQTTRALSSSSSSTTTPAPEGSTSSPPPRTWWDSWKRGESPEHTQYSFGWWLEKLYLCVVFAITGTSAMFLARPLLTEVLGLKGSLREGPWLFRLAYFLVMTPTYSFTLFCIGTLFGRRVFFTKVLRRMWGRLLALQ